METQILQWLIGIPMLAAVLIGLLPAGRDGAVRGIAFGASTLTFLLSIYLWTAFDPSAGFQFEVEVDWIPSQISRRSSRSDSLPLPSIMSLRIR